MLGETFQKTFSPEVKFFLRSFHYLQIACQSTMSKSKRPSSVAPWARTLWIVPAFLFTVGLFSFIGSKVLGLNPADLHFQKSPFQEAVDSLFNLMGMVIVVGLYRRYLDRESFRSMGLYPKGFARESMAGIGLGALLIGGGFTVLVVVNQIQWRGFNWDGQNLLLGLCTFVLVACSEELFLRGYILNNLMKSMNPMVALLVSSVFFSLLHILNDNFSWLAFLNILLAGILIGQPYLYTKRLWLPIGLHLGWNFFQGPIFGFNVSGHVTSSLFTQSRTADTIWNGGPFGFEASVLSLVFQTMAIFGLWWYFRNKGKISSEEIVPAPVCQGSCDQT
ncbi:MAG TPA: CPBP family intramembrane metalloprotease [Prolixibacteraceae bacterium]|jgi:membrane protease YdiL (CAAX protease family)|nr:CPBP family intramembrane metalloprotease [Prolixibacteraceae bacterium]